MGDLKIEQKDIKATINDLEKGVAGVYLIYNVDSHRVYIGRSGDMYKRVHNHFLNMTNNKHINKSMNEDYISGDRFFARPLMESSYAGEEKDMEAVYIIAFREYSSRYGIEMYNEQYSERGSIEESIYDLHSVAIASHEVLLFLMSEVIPFKYSIKDMTDEVKYNRLIIKFGEKFARQSTGRRIDNEQ